MEIIELSGYTEEEKLEIAKRFLVTRQLKANGLTASQAAFDDDALRLINPSHASVIIAPPGEYRPAGKIHMPRMVCKPSGPECEQTAATLVLRSLPIR